MIAAIRKAMRLGRRDRALLARAAVVHTAIVVLIRILPPRWILRWALDSRLATCDSRLSTPDSRLTTDDCRLSTVDCRLAWSVRTVAAATPGSTCLTAALAAHLLLRRSGRESAVRFGVARGLATPLFHCWVECGSRVVIGGETRDRYRALDSCSAIPARTAHNTAFAGN